jgi:hypothetical protein
MPRDTTAEVALECPRCHHHGALLRVSSATVLMVRCPSCRHSWSTDIRRMAPEVRSQLREAILAGGAV